jgi:hypothetical protein
MSDPTSPAETATASARAIGDLPANFMLDMATYAVAADAGYEGMAFYFGGRGGVLGDVDADVVSAAFVYFPPESLRLAWEQAASVESRAAAAQRWADLAAAWAVAHLPADGLDYARLAELAGKVVLSADVAGAPVFAGWRALPEPSGERELALHRLNALRELRAARHATAVLAAGIAPRLALMVKTPYMADIFGWPQPHPEPDQLVRDRWEAAELVTNELFGADLGVLSDAEQAEFVELAEAARTAIVN